MSAQIPGYTYGSKEVERAPYGLEDLEKLKKAVMFTEEDERYLRLAGKVLEDQVEQVLDLWYGWVGSNPHLVYYFSTPRGEAIKEYLEAVRRRFGQWIRDLCNRKYDQDWLNYQYETGLRHHRKKKNKTDGVGSVEHIPLRYVIAFIYPISATIRPFLAKKGHSAEEVEKMHQAWTKAVVLSACLWAYPYANEGDW